MKDVIWAAINDVLEELGLSGADFTVEHPTELSHGDYATNVAMAVAKLAGRTHVRLQTKLQRNLKGR